MTVPTPTEGSGRRRLESPRTRLGAVLGVLAVAPGLTVAGVAAIAPDLLSPTLLVTVVVVLALEGALVCMVVERTHRRTGGERLTAATWVTLGRGGLLAVFAALVVSNPGSTTAAWLSALVFAGAVLLDGVDGVLARATASSTELGARLDTEVDAMGTLVGAAGAVAVGGAPIAFLVVGVARYGFAFGLWRRRRRGGVVRELPRSRIRAALAALVLFSIWFAVLPTTSADATTVLTTLVAVPFVVNFGRDWLVATGRLSN